MQMHLGHDVTDGGKVYFAVAEMPFNELPNHRGLVYRGNSLLIREIK